jgi:hypothetical protein
MVDEKLTRNYTARVLGSGNHIWNILYFSSSFESWRDL